MAKLIRKVLSKKCYYHHNYMENDIQSIYQIHISMRLIDQILQQFFWSLVLEQRKQRCLLVGLHAYYGKNKGFPQNIHGCVEFNEEGWKCSKREGIHHAFDVQHDDEARNECDKILLSGAIHFFAKKYLKNMTVTVTLTLHCESYPPEKCACGTYTTLKIIVKAANNKLDDMNLLMMFDTFKKNFFCFQRVMVSWRIFKDRVGVRVIVNNLLYN